MSISINVLLINSGSRVLLPGVTMALPFSGSIKDLKLEKDVKVGVLSSYSDLIGCLARVVDLTILPNGMPGVVVQGFDRIRVLGKKSRDDQFTYGAIETLSPVDGDLDVSQSLLNSFVESVVSAGLFRRQFPRFSDRHRFTAFDLYSIANRLCSGLERITVLKAESVEAIFDHLKRCVPGAMLFSGNFAARSVSGVTTQPVL